MTAARSISVALSALLVAAGSAGCTATDADTPATATQWATVAGKDLNCPRRTEPQVRPGRPPLRYDLDGDGSAETVVDLVCAGTGVDTAHAADQVEVFHGRKRDTRLARLSVIIVEGPAAEIFLAHGCIYVTANKVVILGHMRPSGADFAITPSLLVSQVSAWDGRGLTPGKFTPMPEGMAPPPGCT